MCIGHGCVAYDKMSKRWIQLICELKSKIAAETQLTKCAIQTEGNLVRECICLIELEVKAKQQHPLFATDDFM